MSLHSLTVEQITAVFQHTHPESEFGGGPMGMAIKFELLPTLDVTALQKLVASILCALPTLNIEELTHRAELERPKEAWMLSILPDCLLRTLQLMADERADAPGVLLDAALIVGKLRHTTYANDEDFRSVRAEIEKHPRFRRRVALAIACSEDIRHAVMDLIWGRVSSALREMTWAGSSMRRTGRTSTRRSNGSGIRSHAISQFIRSAEAPPANAGGFIDRARWRRKTRGHRGSEGAESRECPDAARLEA